MLRPSFLPGLWERIESMIVDGSIRSVDEVEPELSQKDDEVHRWAKAQSELFVPIDQTWSEKPALASRRIRD
jgi:hypothetical protein